MRQACIWKHQNDKWVEYVTYVNENIGLDEIEEQWKEAARQVGVDVDQIETCVEEEGLDLMLADEELSIQYSVTGSPTLLINEGRYQGARDAESYKQAICSAFTEAPEECEEVLESEAAAAEGSC